MPDPSLSSLLDVVHQIEPVIRAHAADAKRERRLSAPVAAAMRAAGLYRMWRPKGLGGLEVDPMTAFQVLEEVARIDSAAGWNLQLSTAVDALGAWFPDDRAAEIFGHPDAGFAGGFFPFRRAVAVDGGYRVTGQTPFASGAHEATWFDGLAHVYDGETQRLNKDEFAGDDYHDVSGGRCGDRRHLAHNGHARHRQPRCGDERRVCAVAPHGVACSL